MLCIMQLLLTYFYSFIILLKPTLLPQVVWIRSSEYGIHIYSQDPQVNFSCCVIVNNVIGLENGVGREGLDSSRGCG